MIGEFRIGNVVFGYGSLDPETNTVKWMQPEPAKQPTEKDYVLAYFEHHMRLNEEIFTEKMMKWGVRK